MIFSENNSWLSRADFLLRENETVKINWSNVVDPFRVNGRLSFKANEIQVWKLDLTLFNGNLVDICNLLSEDEKATLHAFRTEQLQMRFGCTRAFLRMLIGQYLDIAPLALKLSKNQFGKPYLKNHPFKFNVSHASDLALIACCFEYALGVDIERLIKTPDLSVNLDAFLSPGEIEDLKALKMPSRNARFLRIWTVKEAITKALGLGLSLDFARLTVAFDQNGQASVSSCDPVINRVIERIKIATFMVNDTYCGALVRNCDPAKIFI